MKAKQCSKCLREKPLRDFYRLATSKDGRRPDCKACSGKPARVVTVEERYWSKVDKSGDCWLWQASTNTNNGYGRFWANKEAGHTLAHRFVWELVNGPIPDGMEVCHSCDTPACVRPEHLFLGSHSDNIADCVAKGRNNLQELTVEQVLEIKERLKKGGETQVEIAKDYPITRGAIYHIKTGSTWGWLE